MNKATHSFCCQADEGTNNAVVAWLKYDVLKRGNSKLYFDADCRYYNCK